MSVETTTQTSPSSSPAARLGDVQIWLSERCNLQSGLRTSVAFLHDDYRPGLTMHSAFVACDLAETPWAESSTESN
jgi:hypothetical protein